VSDSTNSQVRIGTRKSELALLQTQAVITKITEIDPEIDFQIVTITTSGDRRRDRPIAELGEQGVFVKELEEALLNGVVDLVVHSMKDLPTQTPKGLILAAVSERLDPRDVLVSKGRIPLAGLHPDWRVATSSRRRIAQLKAVRGDLAYVDIRGNIPTRLRQFDDGHCEAMILAAAGLQRLGLTDRISEYLGFDTSVPAVGQGALACAVRDEDSWVKTLVSKIDDPTSRAEVTAERAFLRWLGGGCSIPIGAVARHLTDGSLELTGCVAAADGSRILRKSHSSIPDQAEALGQELAQIMIDSGALSILGDLASQPPSAISPP